ncbi:acyltransferase [Echinicola marina]|uniref:acyltransferase family protein n=1 Tax=Echinicola marina TaxID=2859768 RepID=UPI001CF708F1|nr:acyltransferase [Echinicola marina]UCS91830.1 acyltransferase [Echinicola marina]
MYSTVSNTKLLKTKKHYEILDGLRGLAAVAVVVFHFMEIIVPDYHDNFIAHGYLAVDFFFCLSGFVIAYAYDNRITKIGAGQFFKMRLIRLQPLVIIGSIVGLFAFVFDPFSDLIFEYSFGENVMLFVTSCLMIPYPLVPERYFNNFHLNPPTWSLFWEYIANIIYAFVLFKLRNKALWLLAVLAAIVLWYSAYYYENLSIGWGGDNFWGGGARILFSFLAGMLVYRNNWIIKSRLGFGVLSVLLMAALLFPYEASINWITESVIVIFYFPFLVALGAGATLKPSHQKICVLSGEISYPLYMVHYPFIWLFYSYWEAYSPDMNELILITCFGTVLLIGLAYVVMEYMDKPIRRYLKDRLKRKAQVKKSLVV